MGKDVQKTSILNSLYVCLYVLVRNDTFKSSDTCWSIEAQKYFEVVFWCCGKYFDKRFVKDVKFLYITHLKMLEDKQYIFYSFISSFAHLYEDFSCLFISEVCRTSRYILYTICLRKIRSEFETHHQEKWVHIGSF